MINLEDTVSDMVSGDYKVRFRAEYNQLVSRLNRLRSMLDRYDNGTLEFVPECDTELLRRQAYVMASYLAILNERAKNENIEI